MQFVRRRNELHGDVYADGDRIALSVSHVAEFQALTSRMAMVGADTTLGAQTIVLVGVSMNSLTAQDFLFG